MQIYSTEKRFSESNDAMPDSAQPAARDPSCGSLSDLSSKAIPSALAQMQEYTRHSPWVCDILFMNSKNNWFDKSYQEKVRTTRWAILSRLKSFDWFHKLFRYCYRNSNFKLLLIVVFFSKWIGRNSDRHSKFRHGSSAPCGRTLAACEWQTETGQEEED